ncbi:hypothetical protein G9H71_21765 [Motilibacter sp. E257]|uniref:Uncharacterized protein n=1 Tax=Motilibacter deserti TaxID=2714956 RepID=A0ABX0H018_9ACTN|nr:hypothetical protein [Motilibacter deserti]
MVGRDGTWRLSTSTVNSVWCARYGELTTGREQTASWVAQVAGVTALRGLTGHVTAAPASRTTAKDTNVRVRGRVWPALGGGDVRLQRQVGRSWREVGQAVAGSTGTYTLIATPPNRGANAYRVQLRGAAAYRGATSSTFIITAR